LAVVLVVVGCRKLPNALLFAGSLVLSSTCSYNNT
jgi:Sec-independent protein translocase protein TatA